MANVWNIRGRMNAEKEYDKLYDFNKGRGGQYKYVTMKMLSDGSYSIGLAKDECQAKNLIKQKAL